MRATSASRAATHVFADYLGDALLPRQRKTYERILASSFLDRLTERLIARRDVTLTHGDTHTGNMMLPRSDNDPVTLIDWHLWGIDLAAIDLAFMIALHWPPERRALLEKPLLRFGRTSAGDPCAEARPAPSIACNISPGGSVTGGSVADRSSRGSLLRAKGTSSRWFGRMRVVRARCAWPQTSASTGVLVSVEHARSGSTFRHISRSRSR